MVDNRTGRQYEIAISDHGTIKATDLKKITAGGDGVGLRTYDNGCGAGCLHASALVTSPWRCGEAPREVAVAKQLNVARQPCQARAKAHPASPPATSPSLPQLRQHHRLPQPRVVHRRRCRHPALPRLPH